MWLEIKNLNISTSERIIYENACLNSDSDIIGIYGQNGIGKSTLFNAIYKYREYTGSIKLFGVEIKDKTSHQVSREISYIMQEPMLFDNLTVKANLKMLGVDNPSFNQYYKQFKVKDLLSKKVGELSGGERQVISLAIALAKQSKCLLLDEPFNNLSKINKQIITAILKQEERKIIIISHHELEALDCQQVVIEGRGFNE